MPYIVNLRFEDWCVVVAGMCYAAVAAKQGLNQQWAWSLIWAGYATANFCLTYLQAKG